jgi:hypothetical protein
MPMSIGKGIKMLIANSLGQNSLAVVLDEPKTITVIEPKP